MFAVDALRALLYEDSTSGFDVLFQICTHVAQGHLSLAAARLLGASCLLAIEKDSGGVRPIAIGEALYRLVARSLSLQFRATFSDHFEPWQFGVATRGGCETIVHGLQAIVDLHPDWMVLQLDIQNAFNTVSREAIFHELRSAPSTLDPLFPFGDSLGGALFALGHLRALRATVLQHPNCIFPSYADDTHIVGPVDQVLLAFHTLQDQLASVGLTIQPAKCTAWSPHGLPPSLSLPKGFYVSTIGLRILGAPLGPDSFVQTYAVETLQEALQSLHDLPLLADLQVAFGLLVHCFARRPLYLLRMTVPSLALLAAYGDFDRALLGILEALLRTGSFSSIEGRLAVR
ncbi:hypothetical protein R1flu_018921 [Riccia fluitans]|uniref:Reverse transcriptase domain-containing protein n=1 Tax=Riccia fluitans TaxID=41844 RepID=A0ABD1ZHD4_9MARC